MHARAHQPPPTADSPGRTPVSPPPLLPATLPQRYSHLYLSPGRVVGTFQRIDIPILPQLLQFEFVLFTGAHAQQLQRCCRCRKLAGRGSPC